MKETKSIFHYKGPLEVLTFSHESAEYPHIPAYLVFDETYRKSGTIPLTATDFGPVGYELVHNVYQWSGDNLAEVEKGWILKADTVAGLAGKMKADAGRLVETVGKFNLYCTAGKDGEFDRSKGSMAPLEKPPYYASSWASFWSIRRVAPSTTVMLRCWIPKTSPYRGCMLQASSDHSSASFTSRAPIIRRPGPSAESPESKQQPKNPLTDKSCHLRDDRISFFSLSVILTA